MDIKEIEEIYTQAESFFGAPLYALTPEGAFIRQRDGSVRVYSVDAEGNHYALSQEEQDKRKAAMRKRMGIPDGR